MTVEQEEKLLKGLGLFTLFSMYPLNRLFSYYVDSDDAELYVAIPLMLVLMTPALIIIVLTFRKYSRDKNEGKDLKRYKTTLYWILSSLLIGLAFLIYGLYFI